VTYLRSQGGRLAKVRRCVRFPYLLATDLQ